jgi:outer membrane protein assembly factor BamB
MRTILLATPLLCAFSACPAQPAAEKVVGWRTDTTGCYPDATPPLHWDARKNVVWTAAMPGRSSATPVVVGERIFVMAEPYLLLCLNKSDGKVVWQRENDREKVASKEDLEAQDKLAQSKNQMQEKLGSLRREWAAEDSKAETGDANAKTKAGELKKQVQDLDLKCQTILVGKEVKPQKEVGLACCTPISNGQVVLALYNNGVLACYDLAGNRRWARFLSPVRKGYGQSMSPALVGDHVAAHIDDRIYGLDLKTGKTLWEDYELQHQGSPIGFRVGETDVFLTCEGHLRRAQDGKVLHKIGGALNLFSTPALHGNTGYWISENRRLSICQFEPGGANGLTVKGGGASIPKGIYYASALVLNGHIYAYNNHDYKSKIKTLVLLDAKTRKIVEEYPLEIGGWAYPSPTGAGRFVFASNSLGICVVLAQNRNGTLKKAAENTLEPANACPVFEKDRMYFRGHKTFYCLQASEEDKKEALTLAP